MSAAASAAVCPSCASSSSKVSSLTRLNSSLQAEIVRLKSQSRDNYRVKKINFLEFQLKSSREFAGALGEILISNGLMDSQAVRTLEKRAAEEEIFNYLSLMQENERMKRELKSLKRSGGSNNNNKASDEMKGDENSNESGFNESNRHRNSTNSNNNNNNSELQDKCRQMEILIQSQNVQLACDRLEISEFNKIREELKISKLQDQAIAEQLRKVKSQLESLGTANDQLRSALDQSREAAEFHRIQLLKENSILRSALAGGDTNSMEEKSSDSESNSVQSIKTIQKLKAQLFHQTNQFALAIAESRRKSSNSNDENDRIEAELLISEHENTILKQFESREKRIKYMKKLKEKLNEYKEKIKSLQVKKN